MIQLKSDVLATIESNKSDIRATNDSAKFDFFSTSFMVKQSSKYNNKHY